MSRPAILLVDDEPLLLDTLRANFRQDAARADFYYAIGGEHAIEILSRVPIDVVVTDLRMPGADGCDVLRAAALHCPQAARILLSGYLDETGCDSFALAHQFFVKPMSANRLRDVLRRITAGQARFSSMKERIELTRAASTMCNPAVLLELQKQLARDPIDLDSTTQLITGEPVLAARLVSWANAWTTGSGPRITTVAGALEVVDPARRRILVATLQRAVGSGRYHSVEVDARALNGHHVRVGRVAAQMMSLLAPDRVEEAFLGGIIHDVGVLAMAELGIEGGLSESAPDPHARYGAHILELWGLDGVLVEAVEHHHDPTAASAAARDLAALIYFADESVRVWEESGEIGKSELPETPWIDALGLREFHKAWQSEERELAIRAA